MIGSARRERGFNEQGHRFIMPELAVVIVATDNEQRALLQVLVDGTNVARTAHILRQLSGGGLRSGHAARASRQSRRHSRRYSFR